MYPGWRLRGQASLQQDSTLSMGASLLANEFAPTQCCTDVCHFRSTILLEPRLYRSPLQLAVGVGLEVLWHFVAVEHQAGQHDGQVVVCDAPFAEQVFAFVA